MAFQLYTQRQTRPILVVPASRTMSKSAIHTASIRTSRILSLIKKVIFSPSPQMAILHPIIATNIGVQICHPRQSCGRGGSVVLRSTVLGVASRARPRTTASVIVTVPSARGFALFHSESVKRAERKARPFRFC